jgi:hypothetical protein
VEEPVRKNTDRGVLSPKEGDQVLDRAQSFFREGGLLDVSPKAAHDFGLLGPQSNRRPFLRFVPEEKTEAAQMVKPGLEEPKALDVKVRGGNIQGLASMASQELV